MIITKLRKQVEELKSDSETLAKAKDQFTHDGLQWTSKPENDPEIKKLEKQVANKRKKVLGLKIKSGALNYTEPPKDVKIDDILDSKASNQKLTV